jgi:hypothetical protein
MLSGIGVKVSGKIDGHVMVGPVRFDARECSDRGSRDSKARANGTSACSLH